MSRPRFNADASCDVIVQCVKWRMRGEAGSGRGKSGGKSNPTSYPPISAAYWLPPSNPTPYHVPGLETAVQYQHLLIRYSLIHPKLFQSSIALHILRNSCFNCQNNSRRVECVRKCNCAQRKCSVIWENVTSTDLKFKMTFLLKIRMPRRTLLFSENTKEIQMSFLEFSLQWKLVWKY